MLCVTMWVVVVVSGGAPLLLLLSQAAHPGAQPSEYASLDEDFRRFMHCGSDKLEGECKPLSMRAAAQHACNSACI